MNPIRFGLLTRLKLKGNTQRLEDELPIALLKQTHDALLKKHGLNPRQYREVQKRASQIKQIYELFAEHLVDSFFPLTEEQKMQVDFFREKYAEQLADLSGLPVDKGVKELIDAHKKTIQSSLIAGSLNHGRIGVFPAGTYLENQLFEQYLSKSSSNKRTARAWAIGVVNDLKKHGYHVTHPGLRSLGSRAARKIIQ